MNWRRDHLQTGTWNQTLLKKFSISKVVDMKSTITVDHSSSQLRYHLWSMQRGSKSTFNAGEERPDEVKRHFIFLWALFYTMIQHCSYLQALGSQYSRTKCRCGIFFFIHVRHIRIFQQGLRDLKVVNISRFGTIWGFQSRERGGIERDWQNKSHCCESTISLIFTTTK